jgi:hypothetical protein
MRYLEVEGSNPSCGTTITSLILNEEVSGFYVPKSKSPKVLKSWKDSMILI